MQRGLRLAPLPQDGVQWCRIGAPRWSDRGLTWPQIQELPPPKGNLGTKNVDVRCLLRRRAVASVVLVSLERRLKAAWLDALRADSPLFRVVAEPLGYGLSGAGRPCWLTLLLMSCRGAWRGRRPGYGWLLERASLSFGGSQRSCSGDGQVTVGCASFSTLLEGREGAAPGPTR